MFPENSTINCYRRKESDSEYNRLSSLPPIWDGHKYTPDFSIKKNLVRSKRMKTKYIIKNSAFLAIGIYMLSLNVQAKSGSTLECAVSSYMKVDVDHSTKRFTEDKAITENGKTEKAIIEFGESPRGLAFLILARGISIGESFQIYDKDNKKPSVSRHSGGGFITNGGQRINWLAQFRVDSDSVSARQDESAVHIYKSSEGLTGFYSTYNYYNTEMMSFECAVTDAQWQSFLNYIEMYF